MNRAADRDGPLTILLLGAILGFYLVVLYIANGLKGELGGWLRLSLPSLWLLAASAVLGWRRPPDLPLLRGGRRWWLGAGLAAISAGLVVAMAAAWPDRSRGVTPALGQSLLLALLVPVAEELYFRWLLLDEVRRIAGRTGAVILVSGLFGVLHLPQGLHLPMGVLSLVLCIVALATGSVVWAVIVHVAWNALAILRVLPPGADRWPLCGITVVVIVGLAMAAVWLARRQRSA